MFLLVICDENVGSMPYFVYPTPPAKQHRRIWVKKSHESTKMCDTAKNKAQHSKPCPYIWGLVYIITHEKAKQDKIFECYPVTNRKPIVSWWLAEGYPLTLSANVLRTFRKLSILTFWERYLLTLSGLSANVLLTLFCWVGTYNLGYFWAAWSFQMFTGPFSFQIKPHTVTRVSLSYSVDPALWIHWVSNTW